MGTACRVTKFYIFAYQLNNRKMDKLFKGNNGDFYLIPEGELSKYKVSEDQLKSTLSERTNDGGEMTDYDLDNIAGGTSSEGGIHKTMHQKTLSA